MVKRSTMVGLDVQKDSIDVSIAEEWRIGELLTTARSRFDLRSLMR